jgi:hypothetical protein
VETYVSDELSGDLMWLGVVCWLLGVLFVIFNDQSTATSLFTSGTPSLLRFRAFHFFLILQ